MSHVQLCILEFCHFSSGLRVCYFNVIILSLVFKGS